MSYLRMVLSRVERASLWKVMMMLVGGRSVQYTSSEHLANRSGITQTFESKTQEPGTMNIMEECPKLSAHRLIGNLGLEPKQKQVLSFTHSSVQLQCFLTDSGAKLQVLGSAPNLGPSSLPTQASGHRADQANRNLIILTSELAASEVGSI